MCGGAAVQGSRGGDQGANVRLHCESCGIGGTEAACGNSGGADGVLSGVCRALLAPREMLSTSSQLRCAKVSNSHSNI